MALGMTRTSPEPGWDKLLWKRRSNTLEPAGTRSSLCGSMRATGALAASMRLGDFGLTVRQGRARIHSSPLWHAGSAIVAV